MNNIVRWLVISVFLAMNQISLSFAGEQLNKETLEILIKGYTVEGRKLKWNKTYKMYFNPAGEFKRIDSLGNLGSGEWYIQSNGVLCITGRKEKCRTVKQRDDGGYDVYNRMGEVLWTMDKFSPGDSYNIPQN